MNAPVIEEGDLVAAVTLLAHKYEMGRDILLPGTCGIVTEARPGAKFVRVDFGEPGDLTRWVARESLRVVEERYVSFEPPAPEAVGELWDVVSAQAREIQRLQRELSNLQKETGARLAHAGVDGS
ncbi:MAG TPA: hypothetical protein PKD55_18715 [Bellilinea sp.]|nr:hypothetical protein [Bellilinea sp.]